MIIRITLISKIGRANIYTNLLELWIFLHINNRFISVNFEHKENLVRSWLVLHKGCMPAQQNFQNA